MLNWIQSNIKTLMFFGGLFIIAIACEVQVNKPENFHVQLESKVTSTLNQILRDLSKMSQNESLSSQELKGTFIQARNRFKSIELVIAFYDRNNYKSLMAPNLLRVEEEDKTNVRSQAPTGFQVIEEGIVSERVDRAKLKNDLGWLIARLSLIKNNFQLKKVAPHHVMWMIREALIRVSFTGISGFDSPALNQAHPETIIVLQSIKDLVSSYVTAETMNPSVERLNESVELGIEFVQNQIIKNSGEFDAYHFLKNHTQKIFFNMDLVSESWKVQYPFELALKNDARSLFSKNTFNLSFFSDEHHQEIDTNSVLLGKILFNNPQLSQAGTMSCASCHLESHAFASPQKKDFNVLRNTPTLKYSSLQKALFYDKRAGSLEGQILGVVHNDHEFASSMDEIVARLSKDSIIVNRFNLIFEKGLTDYNVRKSIANYIRTLNTFDSKLDRAMNRQSVNLDQDEIAGMNLFMGKAQCATCHFPPVFNGTLPPNFVETEIENIGVPAISHKKVESQNPQLDSDPGRFHVFQTESRRGFFKTPSLRNIKLTAPYMHHGEYETLEEVMDLYNVGGGQGLGIKNPYQTLPSDSLGLSELEVNQIIRFMGTLTDS